MTKKEVIDFMNNNSVCSLATIDGKKPRVRDMWMYRADDNGIIFHTGTGKDVFKQIQKNPNVELCFYNNNPQDMKQVRVSGIAKLETDKALKDEIVASRPFLKPIIEQYGYEFIAVFRVIKAQASIWTMATNLKPKECFELYK